MAILVITAIGIEIIDELIGPETLMLAPEQQETNPFVELQETITGLHEIAGILFAVLSIIHIIKNWKTLKTYLKNTPIAHIGKYPR